MCPGRKVAEVEEVMPWHSVKKKKKRRLFVWGNPGPF